MGYEAGPISPQGPAAASSPRSLPLAGSPTIVLDAQSLPASTVHGLYVHVPFCFHKCHYCDFYSITRQSNDRMERFVDRVLIELQLWTDRIDRPMAPMTVFIGGGTPSLLPQSAMERLLRGLRRSLSKNIVEEFTVEVNPATADAEYLRMMREQGVDRVSFGAQSFDPIELQTLERHHDPEDVRRSIEAARNAGFNRINIDLIFAIPGQTVQSWARSLKCAIELCLDHYSCYGLTYEPNTPMGVEHRLGRIRAVDEQVELEMLKLARDMLHQGGIEAYEISNHARPGMECRHNLMYWNGGNYLGLGPSAASHVEGVRFRNPRHVGDWETSVDARSLRVEQYERLNPIERAGELVMLQLRLARGLDLRSLRSRFPTVDLSGLSDRAGDLAKRGLVHADSERVRLTSAGIAVADAIAGDLMGHLSSAT
jgi:oxygen-independent coproporphyrinogen-3 oxidase